MLLVASFSDCLFDPRTEFLIGLKCLTFITVDIGFDAIGANLLYFIVLPTISKACRRSKRITPA